MTTHPLPRSESARARLRLWLRLLKSTRSVEADLRERLRREFASTLPRFDVMAALSRFEMGLKMSEISGVLRVSNGNVTGIADHDRRRIYPLVDRHVRCQHVDGGRALLGADLGTCERL